MCVSCFILCRHEKKISFPLASRGKTSIPIDSGQIHCYHLLVPQLAGKVSLILCIYIGSHWAYSSPNLEEKIFFPEISDLWLHHGQGLFPVSVPASI